MDTVPDLEWVSAVADSSPEADLAVAEASLLEEGSFEGEQWVVVAIDRMAVGADKRDADIDVLSVAVALDGAELGQSVPVWGLGEAAEVL